MTLHHTTPSSLEAINKSEYIFTEAQLSVLEKVLKIPSFSLSFGDVSFEYVSDDKEFELQVHAHNSTAVLGKVPKTGMFQIIWSDSLTSDQQKELVSFWQLGANRTKLHLHFIKTKNELVRHNIEKEKNTQKNSLVALLDTRLNSHEREVLYSLIGGEVCRISIESEEPITLAFYGADDKILKRITFSFTDEELLSGTSEILSGPTTELRASHRIGLTLYHMLRSHKN